MSSYQTAFQKESFLNGKVEVPAEPRLQVVQSADAQLVERVLDGDTAAFEELFDRYKRLVAIVASRYFRRHEEIEEMVQVGFAKAYTELENFKGRFERSFPSWLARITANACIDTLRSQMRKPERLNCDLAEHEFEKLLEGTADPSVDAETLASNRDLLDKLLGTISPEDRALLHMLYAEELSVADIADTMGLSVSNVKVKAWRARRVLRKTLARIL